MSHFISISAEFIFYRTNLAFAQVFQKFLSNGTLTIVMPLKMKTTKSQNCTFDKPMAIWICV